jgi:maleate isomerase
MRARVHLGVLTPSSNTVLEPLTSAMVAGLDDVSAHFSRFPVTEISLRGPALSQFDTRPILTAARLLSDARVGCIAWSGTSAGWLGFDADRELCARIEECTTIPATSSVLALDEVFRTRRITRFGLVTPYLDEVQQRIVSNFAAEGYHCAAERHLNDCGNFSYSTVDEDTIAGLVREVARAKPDAITIFCTNFRGARIAPALEQELGLPIYDTVSLAVWKSLKICGVDPGRVQGWGSLFGDEVLRPAVGA